MLRRHASLGFLALLATGCHAGGLRNQARPEVALSPQAEMTRDQVLAKINANASAISSLEARPSLSAVLEDGTTAGLDGYLQFERPRNFRLTMKVMGKSHADIGSNDKGFWIWANDRRAAEKTVLVGSYDENGSSMAGASMQPDWIIEAMGLREYSAEERSRISIERSPALPKGFLLTERMTMPNGQRFIKQTDVDQKGLPRNRKLYLVEKTQKTLIAEAKISRYQDVKLTSADEAGQPIDAHIPDELKLVWFAPQRFELQVLSMAKLRPNPAIDATAFAEPAHYQRYVRQSIDEPEALADATQIRESLPAHPSATMGEPTPLGPDGTQRTKFDPTPLDADLPRLPAEAASSEAAKGLIRPAVPQAPRAQSDLLDRGAFLDRPGSLER